MSSVLEVGLESAGATLCFVVAICALAVRKATNSSDLSQSNKNLFASAVACIALISGIGLVILMGYAIADLEQDRDDHSEPEANDFEAMENLTLNSKSSPAESIFFSQDVKIELSSASACTLSRR